jgi:hypothetical protein
MSSERYVCCTFLREEGRNVKARRKDTKKARGQAQHGGPPGWLEESNTAGVFFYMMDEPYRTAPVALTRAVQMRAQLLLYNNVHNHTSHVRHTRKALPGTLVDLCILSVITVCLCVSAE